MGSRQPPALHIDHIIPRGILRELVDKFVSCLFQIGAWHGFLLINARGYCKYIRVYPPGISAEPSSYQGEWAGLAVLRPMMSLSELPPQSPARQGPPSPLWLYYLKGIFNRCLA